MSKLEEVTLSEDWGKRKAGSTIKVDSLRAAFLKKHGFCGEKRVKKSGRVSKSKTD